MADTVVGEAKIVNLEIHKEAALSFDIEWWDDSVPPQAIPISAIAARLRVEDTIYDLDELGYATWAENVISISLPDTFTATLEAKPGRWRLAATDAIGEESRVLARGSVRIRS